LEAPPIDIFAFLYKKISSFSIFFILNFRVSLSSSIFSIPNTPWRGGWDRGREREVNPFGSDRASTRLGGFQGIKASNKGVIVLKGMSWLWLKVFSFFLFKGLCSVILFPFSATHNGNFRGCSFVAIFILTRLV